MNDIRRFTKEIILCSCGLAVVAELISLFVIGCDLAFSTGLIIGTAISIVGFIILVRSGRLLVEREKRYPVVLGYIIRLILYAVFFLFCIRISFRCAAGCGCGFVTVHFGIMFLYGIIYNLFSKKKNPLNDWIGPKQWNDLSVYDEEDEWR